MKVPKKDPGEGNVTPGHKKTIKLGVVKAELRVQLAEGGKPLANKKYILDVKDEHRTYKYRETDGNGLVKEMVPVNAKDVKLLVGEYKDNSFKPQYKFNLKINHIDPIDTVSGVQARLNNLGFECGEVTDINNTSTKEAVRAFQEKYKNDGLPANGDYKDKATQDKLKDVYGC